jgi:hypothetical protein
VKVLLEGVVHLDRVPVDVVQSKPALSVLVPLEEVVPLNVVPLGEVPQDVVPLEGEVPLDVVHLDKVLLDVVQSNPAPSMLVPLEEVVHLDKVPLDMVPLEEVPQDVVPLEGEVPLGVVHLDKVPLDVVQGKPALSLLVPLEEVSLDEEVSLVDEVPLEEVHLDKVYPYKKVPPGDVVPREEQNKRELHQMEADSPAVNVIAYMCIIAKLGRWVRIGMDPLRGVCQTMEGLV